VKRCLFLLAVAVHAETGRDAWLRYSPQSATAVPAVLSAIGDSPLINSARDEVLRGVRGVAGKTLRLESGMPNENAIVRICPSIYRPMPIG